MIMPQGKLIIFEGTDGSGKSTQVKLLHSWFEQRGYDAVSTFEPTNGPIGKKIRSLYHDRGQVTPEEELDLFIQDRREHVKNLINPALETGKIVICDRYYFSTAAYQGALGFDVDEILKRNQFAPEPDIVLLLQLPVEMGRERIEKLRGESTNDFEKKEMLHKVDAIFRELDYSYFRRIDASQSIEQIHQNVTQIMQELLD